MGRLKNKRVVVTGAGRGIGKKIAQMMAAQGADVLASDINNDALLQLTEEAPEIQIQAGDLTTETGAAALSEAAMKLFDGRIDILVNAAAIVKFGPIDELSKPDWDITLRGEIDTVFLVTRTMWPLLKASGKGSIINFSSANAHVALDGLPAIAHTAGKGAVLAMTRQLAMEGGAHNIRANTIAPGFTVTEETEQHLNTPLMKNVRAKIMLDGLGQTEDIGWLAIYLGSDESRFVTGADFRVDGGATAW